jgi:hypothetical protein
MKRVAMLLSVVVTSTASAQFEGVVTYQVGTSGETMQYSTKGSKVRMDVNDTHMPGGMAAIMDVSAMTMTLLINQQHMYMTMPIPQNANVPDTARGKFVKTGSEVIAGIPCDDYVGQDSKGEKQMTFCLAHGMGNFAQYSTNNPMMRAWASHISGLSGALSNGGFPLKVVKSNGQTEMVATKVERRPVDASLFTVPAGYTLMQMPAGMPQH